MPQARANGVELEYETFGSSDEQPLLMIMGLGAQMQFWDDEFCTALASRKHYVIRFDNRDVGLSTWFDEAGTPDIMQVMMGMAQGKPVTTPYGLDDMADDCAGLLDALEIADAHICGASMGGMIAQVVAIRHPETHTHIDLHHVHHRQSGASRPQPGSRLQPGRHSTRGS